MEADKHKFQRFLTADAAFVVTVFAPITFPPASVLLFKQRRNGMLDLGCKYRTYKYPLAP